MQTVADLDEDHANVVAHRQQQFLEILRLSRCLVAKDAAGNLRQAIDDLRHLGTKDGLDVLHGVVSVLHYVVKKGGADARGAQAHLGGGNQCHGDGVHDIGLAREAADALVGLTGEIKRLVDDVHLLAVGRGEVACEQLLVGGVHHRVVGGFTLGVFQGLEVLIHRLAFLG